MTDELKNIHASKRAPMHVTVAVVEEVRREDAGRVEEGWMERKVEADRITQILSFFLFFFLFFLPFSLIPPPPPHTHTPQKPPGGVGSATAAPQPAMAAMAASASRTSSAAVAAPGEGPLAFKRAQELLRAAQFNSAGEKVSSSSHSMFVTAQPELYRLLEEFCATSSHMTATAAARSVLGGGGRKRVRERESVCVCVCV
jgi:hypothetical protein